MLYIIKRYVIEPYEVTTDGRTESLYFAELADENGETINVQLLTDVDNSKHQYVYVIDTAGLHAVLSGTKPRSEYRVGDKISLHLPECP